MYAHVEIGKALEFNMRESWKTSYLAHSSPDDLRIDTAITELLYSENTELSLQYIDSSVINLCLLVHIIFG